jgi:phosphonate transport system permease protein
MQRTSVVFLLVALAALAVGDISVSTFDPWLELTRLARGLASPDFFSLPGLAKAVGNTLAFALIGMAGAVVFGSILSLFFAYRPVRLFCAFIRAIHELFWAFIFMPVIGLNSLCGILAIAVPYAGVLAKVYAEIRQEADLAPADALPKGTGTLSAFLYTTLPITYPHLKNYTAYRFECALRSSTILGFIGLPTLGYHLETAFREGLYSEAAALLYIFYLMIISLKVWARAKIIALPVLAACFFISWNTAFSLDNIIRFFTYDILPWPVRAEGFYDGTRALSFSLPEVLTWAGDIGFTQALPGIWNTLLLTQIALVLTAVFTLAAFVPACRLFFSFRVTAPAHLVLVILRTTPEYILAYVGLQLWGPSMLPAIFALSLHNGGILAYLTAKNADLLVLPFDTAEKRLNRYFYEVLPRCYGQFLAFLFYRWEVIMRESAILGILGITTLGFYIDSAMAKDHLDTALLLILVTALMNMGVDTLSRRIRTHLRISAHVTGRSGD